MEKTVAGLEIQRVPVGQMNPAAYNPRRELHPGDARYERIKASLQHHGYAVPIVWNRATGNIVGGHQRYRILCDMGATEIDCSVVDIADPSAEKSLNIALNKIDGEWDEDKLGALLQEMRDQGYQMEATGMSEDEIGEYIKSTREKSEKHPPKDPDDVPDNVRTFAFSGDVWQLGVHRMVCGDATKAEDVELLMQGDVADLILTDPPYNVAYESADGKKIENDNMASDQFYRFLLESFSRMKENSAKDAVVYVFHADTEGYNFRKALVDAGFDLDGTCIWAKDSLVLGRSPFQWQHEPVLVGHNPDGTPRWYGGDDATTVWRFDKPKRSEEHPTMKPVPLLIFPIRNSSKKGDIVLDPFGGSGSTLIACEQAGRVCRTMELDPKYASVIVARYHDMYPTQEISVTRNGRKEVWSD